MGSGQVSPSHRGSPPPCSFFFFFFFKSKPPRSLCTHLLVTWIRHLVVMRALPRSAPLPPPPQAGSFPGVEACTRHQETAPPWDRGARDTGREWERKSREGGRERGWRGGTTGRPDAEERKNTGRKRSKERKESVTRRNGGGVGVGGIKEQESGRKWGKRMGLPPVQKGTRPERSKKSFSSLAHPISDKNLLCPQTR